MVSVKNPNKPSRNRVAARAAKGRKAQQKRSAAGKSGISKIDAQRGARPGILPTSGPRAALSSKKQRKLERALRHATRRKMEADGEIDMKDAAQSNKETKQSATADDQMELDRS